MKRTKEVFAAVTAFSLLVLPAKMEAGNNEAAAIAAGVAIVALAVSQNQNGETKCTPTNWKNYVTGVKMTAAPATAIIDDKYTACEKKIFSFAATPEDTEAYRIDPFALKHVSGPDNNGLYYTVIASKSVDQASAVFGGGDKSEDYTVWFDVNGTVKKADSPVSEMIGKKLFNIDNQITITDKTVSKEIVYSGITGNTIHFIFRKYVGTMIKWPFTIPLSFDLSKSHTITVEHYHFRVLKAGNDGIEYIVDK